MATYKEKVGTAVVNYAGDYPGAVEGELWYDSTNKDFKYNYPNVSTAGSWRTANSMNTARAGGAGAGIYTAALAFAGSPSPVGALTEKYDGTSWTEVNDLNTSRASLAGNGTQTSALAIAGEGPPGGAVTNVESWNGTNWTETTDLNTARYILAAAGADNTSALAFGGGPPPVQAYTELWNGSNWTEVNDLNQGRAILGGAGIATAALAFGGRILGPNNYVANTESWNGISRYSNFCFSNWKSKSI